MLHDNNENNLFQSEKLSLAIEQTWMENNNKKPLKIYTNG
jgi:hypothetical protein